MEVVIPPLARANQVSRTYYDLEFEEGIFDFWQDQIYDISKIGKVLRVVSS